MTDSERNLTTIAVAPNGGRKTKADHPAVPLTAAELARTAAECLEAGATMIHVHVRAPDGTHLLDAGAYLRATAAIKAETGDRMVVQITSEALGQYAPEAQRAVVREVRPQSASLALRELVPDESEEKAFAELLSWMKAEHVVPQIILYTPEEAARLSDMMRRGLIPAEDIPVLYVLGRYTEKQMSEPADLLPFLAPGLPSFGHWSVCAFGPRETGCVTTAALLGGHMRVGFENNLWLPGGGVAGSNAEIVAGTAAAIAASGLHLGDAAAWRPSGW
ncbi:3-keto-5-aminohexanoate cleavage protein [Rhizobium sp. PAMB 3182]